MGRKPRVGSKAWEESLVHSPTYARNTILDLARRAEGGSKEAVDLELLTHVLEHNLEDSPHGREFFIRKAVGWALRQHARVDPAWVAEFVAAHHDRLSGLSRREALKHVATVERP